MAISRTVANLPIPPNAIGRPPTTARRAAWAGRSSGCRNPAPLRVGAIGLGVGTLAAYAKPGDVFRFYEINPQVVDMAKRHFTYLADCRGKCEIKLGDARLSLEAEPPQRVRRHRARCLQRRLHSRRIC